MLLAGRKGSHVLKHILTAGAPLGSVGRFLPWFELLERAGTRFWGSWGKRSQIVCLSGETLPGGRKQLELQII